MRQFISGLYNIVIRYLSFSEACGGDDRYHFIGTKVSVGFWDGSEFVVGIGEGEVAFLFNIVGYNIVYNPGVGYVFVHPLLFASGHSRYYVVGSEYILTVIHKRIMDGVIGKLYD